MSTPPDSTYSFESHGRQGEIHIHYYAAGIAYEVRLDGKPVGTRQGLPANENELEGAQRIAESMEATSLRRL
jgi:hypothetical protein